MINREATIRWKGYDPKNLSKGSHKRVWAVCDNCERGRWVDFCNYCDLCGSCSGKKRYENNIHPMKDRKHSKKSRDQMSESHIGSTQSEKTKRKRSKALIGANNPMFGKQQSDETRKKNSDSHKGKGVGSDNPFYGKSHTEEFKEKQRQRALNQTPKFRDTSIEIKMQKILTKYGYDYQKHKPCCGICIPDIVFSEKKIAIFCDGDYWHNLPNYVKRDQNQDKVLKANGWIPLRFWEYEINENIQDCFRRFKAIYHDTEYTPYYKQGTLSEWM